MSDSEFDSYDLRDVKFLPNISSFVLESQENFHHDSNLKKTSKTSRHHNTKPSCPAHGTLTDKSNKRCQSEMLERKHDCLPGNYVEYFYPGDDVTTAVNAGCLLPEFPELRDSYDQFCITTSEHSSRDDLDRKLGNRDSATAISNELKSARGMRGSMYSSDEIVHACKRRKTVIAKQLPVDGNNHRWSMPEFNSLWKENCESGLDYYLNNQHDALAQEGDQQFFTEKSTQTLNTPARVSDRKSIESLQEHPHFDVDTVDHRNIEKMKCAPIGESTSCPSFSSVECQESCVGLYDSSGFYDDSDTESLSPMHSRTSINTVKENPHWLEYKAANKKDSGIYANDEDSSTSVSEIYVCASDSGYSEMNDTSREESIFEQIQPLRMDMRETRYSYFGKETLQVENNKRCAHAGIYCK